MEDFPILEGLQMLQKSDIYTALYHGRLNLQQTILLKMPKIRNAFAQELDLPNRNTFADFQRDYFSTYYTEVSIHYVSPYRHMLLAARYGKIDVVKSYVASTAFELTQAIEEAMKGSHIELASYLLSSREFPGEHRDQGFLIGAVKSKDPEIFNMAMEIIESREAHLNNRYWEHLMLLCLETAARLNLPHIFELILPFLDTRREIILEKINKCRIKMEVHRKDIAFIQEVIKSNPSEDLKRDIVVIAAQYRYLEIINLFVKPLNTREIEEDIYLQLVNSSLEIPSDPKLISAVVQGAVQGGHFDLYNQYCGRCCDLKGARKGLEYLIENNERKDFIETLISINSDFVLLNSGLHTSIRYNDVNLMIYFLEKGATDRFVATLIAGRRRDTYDLIPIIESYQ